MTLHSNLLTYASLSWALRGRVYAWGIRYLSIGGLDVWAYYRDVWPSRFGFYVVPMVGE
jgi:hypothetical protein